MFVNAKYMCVFIIRSLDTVGGIVLRILTEFDMIRGLPHVMLPKL